MSSPSIDSRPTLPSHTRLIIVALFLSLVVHFVMLLVIGRIPIHGISTNVEEVINKLAAARDLFPPVRVEPLPENFYRPPDRPATDDTLLRPVDITRDAIAEWIRAAVPLPELPPASSSFDDLPPPNINPALSAPAAVAPDTTPVFVRQEVLKILDRKINEALAVTPRRELPPIPRETHAKFDFAPPSFPIPDLPQILPAAPSDTIGNSLHIAQLIPSAELITKPSSDITPAQPAPVAPYVGDPILSHPLPQKFNRLDERLSAGIQAFHAPDGYLYFRIALKPASPDVLPVQSRDVLFIQDASTSLSEARLQFCKRALTDALATLSPDDRFNIMAFNNTATTAFPSWQSPDPVTLDRAKKFISGMTAAGSTDFFSALQKALDMPREEGRPVIAILITDGQPTAGMTGSTQIIGEFTRLNNGEISLFALGTHGVANAYLLDLLTHSNRGAVHIASGTRWDLPQIIAPFIQSTSAPLMHAMYAQFTGASDSEVYPAQLSNLYADRTLDIYGRTPVGTSEIVMQLRGATAESVYDAIFRLPLSDLEPGPASLRERWAQLKMYDLIGRYARNPDSEIFNALKRLSAEYGVPMFYEREISK